jgi:hypothetical protein
MARLSAGTRRFSRAIAAAWLLGTVGIVATVAGCGEVTTTPTDQPTTTKPAPTGTTPSRDAIDPSTVTWLQHVPTTWTLTSNTNFAITSVTNPVIPTICWDQNIPTNWIPDPSGITIGNLWILVKISGTWYGTPVEWLITDQSFSRCTTMENYEGQPPFIQTKSNPIASYYPQSGEQIGFMVTSLPHPWGGSGPLERSQIVMTTYP